jgi:hypothetical protein
MNGRLAEIAAELSAEAKFKEPSAAERARARVGQPWPASSGRRLSARRLSARRVPGRGAARGRPQPVPDRGYATASGGSAHRSLLILVSTLVVIIAACACVVALANRP